jgi:hypothetical protein
LRLWAKDPEGDTFTVSLKVLDAGNNDADITSTVNTGFTLTSDITVNPFNYVLTFNPVNFDRTKITGVNGHVTYKLVITVKDSKSIAAENPYTITVTIDNTNHAPKLAAGGLT